MDAEQREPAPRRLVVQLPPDDPWLARGYAQASIEPGERPAMLVVDLQYAFTDPAFDFGGAELIERATVNTARLLETARSSHGPVFQTIVAWEDERDRGLWTIKLPPCADITPDSRWARVDERVWDDSDVLLPKKWPIMRSLTDWKEGALTRRQWPLRCSGFWH